MLQVARMFVVLALFLGLAPAQASDEPVIGIYDCETYELSVELNRTNRMTKYEIHDAIQILLDYDGYLDVDIVKTWDDFSYQFSVSVPDECQKDYQCLRASGWELLQYRLRSLKLEDSREIKISCTPNIEASPVQDGGVIGSNRHEN